MKVITEELIERLAGKAAYQRGIDYCNGNAVGALDTHGNTISAQVQGGELYQVTLKHTTKIFEGFCDCPASDGFDFCKHCVAVSLEYLRKNQSQEHLQQSKEGDLIANYLATMNKKELIDVLAELIRRDKQLSRTWKLHASIAAGKMGAVQIKKHITSAIPLNRSAYKYSDVRKYFAAVEQSLIEIKSFLEKLPAEKAITLIDYAIGRVDRALETVDDSGGFRFESLEILAHLHQDTLQRCSWSAQNKADYLLDIYLGDLTDCYPTIPSEYESLLGEQGLDAFKNSIQERWDALPKLPNDASWETEYRYRLFLEPLLDFVKKKGDYETEISLLEKVAITTSNFITLSRICLNNDLYDRSVQWHDRAVESADGLLHHASVDKNQIQLWRYKKQYDKIFELLWQQFTENLAMETYQSIEELSEQIGDTTDNLTKAVEIAQKQATSSHNHHAQIAKDLIAELHLYTEHTDTALEIAERWKLHPSVLFDIIKVNRQHVGRVLPLGFRLADFWVKQGDNKCYKQAVTILKFLEDITDDSHRHIFNRQLAVIRTEYKRKINFCKFLLESGL